MASSTSLCGVCDQSNINKPSIIWCFECDEGLCSECKDHHSRSKGTRKHDTVPISEYQQIPSEIVNITQTCDKHNEKYTIYCKKHEHLCCGSCIVENHMECRDFDKLADVIQNIKHSNALYEIEQSLEELSDNIKKIRNDREHKLRRLSEKKKQIEQEVKQTRMTINNHLDKIQDDMMKKINATEEKERKLIRELLNLLEENDRKITEYRTNIENIKQHATDLHTFISIKKLEKNISIKDEIFQSVINSENFKDREMFYNYNAAMQNLPNHITSFGEVKITTTPCDIVLTRRKDRQAQIMMPQVLSKSVQAISLKLHKTINKIGMYIRGCCMLPNGKIVFSNKSLDPVKVFKFNGTKDFSMVTRSCVFDIAYISHDNTLAVTSGESDTKCIIIIDIQSKQIKDVISVDPKYYGIAVTSDGKFICSAEGKGIQLINPQNNSTINIVRDKIPGLCYLAQFCDKIYHTNNQSNSVICHDLQGTVKWTFKNVKVLRRPSGISVNNDGNVYVVGNLSNNVVVLSADGKQFKEIATSSDGLCNPLSIDYNRTTNQLLVTNLSNKAFAFTVIE